VIGTDPERAKDAFFPRVLDYLKQHLE